MKRRRKRPVAASPAPAPAPASAPPAAAVADRWGDWLAAALFVLLAFLLGITELSDTDIWWHLRTGQLMWERGEIPQTDWFTYTNPESPWIDLHWGFQLMVAALWAVGGSAALILAKSVVGTATFALGLAAQKREWPLWTGVACWLPSLLLFAGRYHERPEMLSLLFFAATLAILFHLRAHPRLVWLLPLVQLVWVNVHALFILGLALWAFFLIDAAARRWLAPGVADSESGGPTWRNWLIATGLQGAACLLNPYGIHGALFPLVLWTRIQGSQRDFYRQFAGEFEGIAQFVAEHGMVAMFQNVSTVMLMLIAPAGLASFLLLARRGQFSLFRALVFGAFGYLGWQANRNEVFFALAGGAVLRWNVGDLLALRAPRPARALHPGRAALTATVGVLAALTPLQFVSFVRRLPAQRYNPSFLEWDRPPFIYAPRWFGLQETPYWYAHDAVRFLGRPGMPERVYASHLGHASLYIYEHGPQRKVFADPRLEVNTRETLARYQQIQQLLLAHDPAAERLLLTGVEPDAGEEAELPALLIGAISLLPIREPMFSHPRWRCVYADPVAGVFLSTQQADALGLPAVPWQHLLGMAPPVEGETP